MLYVPLHRTGVDGMEQAINDWASELNFIQVYITICDMCICVTLHTDRGFIVIYMYDPNKRKECYT